MYREILALINRTLPTSRLHTQEHLLTNLLTQLDAKDRPFVKAILNTNFNLRPNGELIKQTHKWYQSHLTVPCSTFALTAINIAIQDNKIVFHNYLLTFVRTVRPYLVYDRLIKLISLTPQ